MIDPSIEDLFTFAPAGKQPEYVINGRPRPPMGVYRDHKIGAKDIYGNRVRLEAIKTPRGLCTSREAIRRFFAALSGLDQTEIPSATPRRQADRAEQAQKELAAMGFDRAQDRGAA